jgi:hypothetical protein
MEKKIFLLYIACYFCIEKLSAKNYSGNTYVKTRNLQSYNFIIGAELLDNIDNNMSSIFISPLCAIGNTIDNNLGQALSINKKRLMLFAGDNNQNNYSRDIRAEYIGGSPENSGFISINPSQSLYGIKAVAQIPLSNLFQNNILKNISLGLRTVFTSLEQSCYVKIDGTENDRKGIQSFFKNTTDYGKIDSKKKFSEMGFESIALTIESIYRSRENKLKIHYYTGLEIPTTSVYSSEYLFYPRVGNNGHLGLLLGAHLFSTIYEKKNFSWGIFSHLENHFSIYRTIKRTFDLYQNDMWSKYLPITKKDYNDNIAVKTVSGLTHLPVRIHPTNNLDISLGIKSHYTHSDEKYVDFSFGYNIWFAQKEYSELRDRAFRKEYKNFYAYGIQGSTPQQTSSKSTIYHKAPDDTLNNMPFEKTFVINDLDMSSVSAEGGHTQSLFLRISGSAHDACFSIGTWGEYGEEGIMPSRYGLWIGGGVSW